MNKDRILKTQSCLKRIWVHRVTLSSLLLKYLNRSRMTTLWECWGKRRSMNSVNNFEQYNLQNPFYLWDSLILQVVQGHTASKRLLKTKCRCSRSDFIYRKRKSDSMWFNNLVLKCHYCETQMWKKCCYRWLLHQYAEKICSFGDWNAMVYYWYNIKFSKYPWDCCTDILMNEM